MIEKSQMKLFIISNSDIQIGPHVLIALVWIILIVAHGIKIKKRDEIIIKYSMSAGCLMGSIQLSINIQKHRMVRTVGYIPLGALKILSCCSKKNWIRSCAYNEENEEAVCDVWMFCCHYCTYNYYKIDGQFVGKLKRDKDP